MTGNMRKGGFWNRPGSVNRQGGKPGGTGAGFRDALTVEDAVKADSIRRSRDRREAHETRVQRKAAEAKAKITLSSPEWLANFMKD